jgi:hypothetical protein
VCYCDDCQSFAHFLGRANQILDEHGGTEIFQTSPARLRFTQGADRLGCMRLTSKGMFRWYADCCKTPIGNTLPTHQLPFVGLIHSCIERSSPGASLDPILGPIRGRVQGRYAKGDMTGLSVGDRPPVSMILGLVGALLMARLRGDHKKSPFFDRQNGEPIATPHILTERELRDVEAARDAS